MVSDGTCHIWHATVADLDIVSIEQLAVVMMSREVLVNQT